MSAAHTTQAIFEIIAAAALIVAVLNENKIAEYERLLFNKIKEVIRRK